MGAMSKRVDFPLGPLEIEAVAAEEGISLSCDLGLKDIVLESDSKTVIKAFSEHGAAPVSIQKIVEGTKTCLRCFNSWRPSHTRRAANSAAHPLVKDAKSLSDSVIWVEDSPPIIAKQTLNDVIHLDLGHD